MKRIDTLIAFYMTRADKTVVTKAEIKGFFNAISKIDFFKQNNIKPEYSDDKFSNAHFTVKSNKIMSNVDKDTLLYLAITLSPVVIKQGIPVTDAYIKQYNSRKNFGKEM